MGQGEEKKTRPEPSVEIQERGEIFFFYRPKVEKEEAHGADDVQRMYLVMRPESGEKRFEETQSQSGANNDNNDEDKEQGGSHKVDIEEQALVRYIVMGRKSLPDPKSTSRPYWGFVEMVTTHIQEVKDALRGKEYDTATRGYRHQPDARPVGEGIYRILRHFIKNKNMHTHLIYKLEYPAQGEKEEPQQALNIAREASFILQIKNPDASSSSSSNDPFRGGGGPKKKRKAAFPAHLQALLGRHKRFHPADPPDFLNYQGCEFLLISASDDIEQELGLELEPEQVDADDQQCCSDLVQTFGKTVANSTRPLLKGTWL